VADFGRVLDAIRAEVTAEAVTSARIASKTRKPLKLAGLPQTIFETTLCLCHMPHIITPHRTEYRGLSVCLSLCQSVTLVGPAKNGLNDQVAICVLDSGGPNEPRIT